jgi:hypothetical protein
VGHVGLLVCQVMSIPAFRAVVLDMLLQKVEAPMGDGQLLRSLLGWFNGVARLTSQSSMTSMWWITLKISLLGGWPLLFSLEWWGFIWYGVYDSSAVCH